MVRSDSSCLFSLGLESKPLTAEARQVWDEVRTDVILFERCANEVKHQETLKEEQDRPRRAIVRVFSKICVERCEHTAI